MRFGKWVFLAASIVFGSAFPVTSPAGANEKLKFVSDRITWQRLGPGMDHASVTVKQNGTPVEKMTLFRFDPAHYRLTVHHDYKAPSAPQWRKRLGAAIVINGGYFMGADAAAKIRDGMPATPILADRRRLGPKHYRSSHGVLLSEPTRFGEDVVTFRDFGGKSQKVNLKALGYRHAIVSFPTLVDFWGQVRARKTDRTAERTFIGIDRQKRVLIGVTRGGYFTLHQLGLFLRKVPGLNGRYFLNLDGGRYSAIDAQVGKLKLGKNTFIGLPMVVGVSER